MKNILLCFLLWVSIPTTCSEHKVQDIVITIPTHTDSTQTSPPHHHRHQRCSTKMKIALISSGTTIGTAILIILLKFYL